MNRPTRIFVLACCLLLALSAVEAHFAVALGQQPAAGNASIAGTVRGDASSQPIRRAIVTISGGGLPQNRTTITDDAGRFVLGSLPNGRFTISVKKPAYLPGAYGAKRPGRPGTPIALADGQHLDVEITITRGAVITGTLTDRDGSPAAAVPVAVLNPLASVADERPPFAPEYGTRTDDRGVYRIYGLPPGDYVVAATPRVLGSGPIEGRSVADMDALLARLQSSRLGVAASTRPSNSPQGTPQPPPPIVTYAPTYFPGTTRLVSATRIKIGPGEERNGVDFVAASVPAATVDGTVVAGNGPLPSSVNVGLVIEGFRLALYWGGDAPRLSVAPGPDGRFKIANLAPGRYTIVASADRETPTPSANSAFAGLGRGGARPTTTAPTNGLLYAQADIDIDGRDLSGVTLALEPGLTLAGRVIFQGASVPPLSDLTALRVNLTPAEPVTSASMYGLDVGSGFSNAPPGLVKPDGSFEIAGIGPGTYRIGCKLPAGAGQGWWLRSAIVGGRDALDFPLEIKLGNDLPGAVLTFSDQHTEVSGTLQSATGVPAPDYFVVAFPSDRTLWTRGSRRELSIRPGTDGAFVLRDLPPGDYQLAAVTDIEPSDLNDIAFLEQLVGASVKITLGSGQKRIQNIRIAGGSARNF